MNSPSSFPSLLTLIDVKNFGAETVRVGDLNGDGAPDLLFVQSIFHTRSITCLTATTIEGRVLWQHGEPSAENGKLYSDLPVQIYDFDNDGRNEVLYVQQAKYLESDVRPDWPYRERGMKFEGTATMIVLDAATGKEKRRFAVPAPADDCFLFADLTGRGRRQDLVMKDRYFQIFGVSHEGQELWSWSQFTGHFPNIADIDDDGRDEVFTGFSLIDHDGKVLWEHPHNNAHQDAVCITRADDGSWRLLFGNGGVHCLSADGAQLWHKELNEAQHVVLGRFRPDLGNQQILVVNRGERNENGHSQLYLFDMEGKEIWRKEEERGAWAAACVPIDWSGNGVAQEALLYGRGPGQPAVIYNGRGEIIERLPLHHTPERTESDRQAAFYGVVADLWGDSRQEVLLTGSRGACIHTNRRPLAIPTLYNHTLYPGM